MATTVLEDRLSRLRFDYTIRRGDTTEQLSELHELGLFTEAETLQAFAAAGLAAQHEAASSGNRGMYLARVA